MLLFAPTFILGACLEKKGDNLQKRWKTDKNKKRKRLFSQLPGGVTAAIVEGDRVLGSSGWKIRGSRGFWGETEGDETGDERGESLAWLNERGRERTKNQRQKVPLIFFGGRDNKIHFIENMD